PASDTLQQAGVKSVFFVSPDSAHDFTSWKRSLYLFAPLLFQDLALSTASAQKPVEPSVATPSPADTAPAGKTIRIKAGQDTPFKDSSGNVWEAERGFEGGAVIGRDAET